MWLSKKGKHKELAFSVSEQFQSSHHIGWEDDEAIPSIKNKISRRTTINIFPPLKFSFTFC